MSHYAKAIVGALIAFLTAIAAGLQDASADGSDLTGLEWVTALLGLLVALAAVWAVPNKPPPE